MFVGESFGRVGLVVFGIPFPPRRGSLRIRVRFFPGLEEDDLSRVSFVMTLVGRGFGMRLRAMIVGVLVSLSTRSFAVVELDLGRTTSVLVSSSSSCSISLDSLNGFGETVDTSRMMARPLPVDFVSKLSASVVSGLKVVVVLTLTTFRWLGPLISRLTLIFLWERTDVLCCC